MHITSPEDRAIAWRQALSRRGEERETALRYLSRDILEELRAPLSLYHEGEEEFVETILLLDRHDAFLDQDMLTAYQSIGVTDDEAPARALMLIAARLGTLAADEETGPETRARVLELGETWRDHVLSTGSDSPEYLTVAEVAARFGVSPAAVYKWGHAGKIEWEETPGGSYRIPAGQFQSSQDARDRRAAFRRRTAERWRSAPPMTEEEIVEAVRSSRRA
jgi:excisionase family DNA binding protein